MPVWANHPPRSRATKNIHIRAVTRPGNPSPVASFSANHSRPRFILTVPGRGYRYREVVAAPPHG